MIAAQSRHAERGFTLIEVLVTVAIIGITCVVFIGGMGTSFLASNAHRKQAVAQASIRNFAEAVKAAPFSTDCANAASKYLAAYNAPAPSSSASLPATQSHVAPSVLSPSNKARLLAFYALAGGTDVGLPQGMTVGWTSASKSTNVPSRVTVAFADQAITAEGPTGTRTAFSSLAVDSVQQTVAVPSTVTAGVARRDSLADATPATGATKLTLSTPPSTLVGDALFAQVAIRNTAATVTPPVGWTLVSSKTHGTAVTSAIYQKVATTTGSAAGDWIFSATTEAAGGIVAYRNAASGYAATITEVKYWNGTAFTMTCPAPEANDAQLVSLRLVSFDNEATQTIDIVKRCRQKHAAGDVCEDSP